MYESMSLERGEVKRSKVIFNLFLVFLLAEFFMPPVPNDISISVICFVLLTFLLFIYAFLKRTLKINIIIFSSLIILFSVTALIALIKGVPIGDISRGIAPFIFLLVFYPISIILNSKAISLNDILKIVMLYGLAYSINNIYLYIWNEVFNPVYIYRITILDPNTLSSVPLFLNILSYSLFVDSPKNNKKSFIYLSIFIISLISIVVTQTRSMLLCAILLIIVISLFSLRKLNKTILKRLISITFLAILGIGFIYLFLRDSDIITSFKNRLLLLGSSDSNVTERIVEYEAALNVLKENYFFGGGIGLRFSAHDGVVVNYIHNSFMYSLANFGLIGTVVILIAFLVYVIKSVQIKNTKVNAFMFAFISIQLFTLFFSTYKWFSHNILSAICIAITIHCSMEIKNVKR